MPAPPLSAPPQPSQPYADPQTFYPHSSTNSIDNPSFTACSSDDNANPSPAPIRTPCGSVGRSTYSPIPRPSLRGARVRSRTTNLSFTPPLAPVMSRENSMEEVSIPTPAIVEPSSLPSSASTPTSSILGRIGRKASKSVSIVRPSASVNASSGGRAHSVQIGRASTPNSPMLSFLPTPAGKSSTRIGLKRRISTPSLVAERADAEEAEASVSAASASTSEKKKDRTVTRGRSTSTSYVVPEPVEEEKPVAGPSRLTLPAGAAPVQYDDTGYPYGETYQPIPVYVAETGAKAEQSHKRSKSSPLNALEAAYNAGESSLLRFARWVRPSRRHGTRRDSDGDSEKGLEFSEEDFSTSADSASVARTSEDSVRRGGKYWIGGSEDDNASYFSLPATPPAEPENESGFADFALALPPEAACLPTPALSTKSLSRAGSKVERFRTSDMSTGPANEGWLSHVVARVWTKREPTRSEGKFSSVIRELGWTIALLSGLFLITAATAAFSITSMPITQLKHLPKSTTDLQLLSAEIRKYMASGDVGYYHTVGVLVFIGCWKHAWSVPGAVVLNILVGSILDTFSAVALLTFITATGSLFCYLLSRPLAPLITVLFPKPLSLVRAALAPDQVPTAPNSAMGLDEKVTAIQVSSNPSTPPVGSESSGSVWRRLLIMRATGFVPWSGMNVACGVVEVDWKVFWLTTAAGSASWSYVTASVGNILSRLAIPEGAASAAAAGESAAGESLTSLLRDPYLIAKLVLLSAASLIPVLFKKRNVQSDASATLDRPPSPFPHSPTSPLSRSLARFTPTPAAFDLLSFGRTAARQGSSLVMGSVRGASAALQRVAQSVSSQ